MKSVAALLPNYQRALGAPVETIVPTVRFGGFKLGAFGSWAIANVTADLNDLITLHVVYTEADTRALVSANWGVSALVQQNLVNFRPLGDRAVEHWGRIAPATATRTLTLTWSGAISRAVAIVVSWAGIASAIYDVQTGDASPPQAIGAPAFSGFTAPTAQAHELILGGFGYDYGGPLINGGWTLPLVALWSANDPGGALGIGLEVAWYPATAIAAYEARRVGWSPPIVDWGMLCDTYRAT